MSTQYAFGSRALGLCDVCGQRYKLAKLRALIVNKVRTNTLACPRCWVPDQPQYQVGRVPVVDPQALKNPRPDNAADSRVIITKDLQRSPVSRGVIDVISPLGGTVTDV